MSVYIIGNLCAGFMKPAKGAGIVGVIVRGAAGAGGGGVSSLAQIIISDDLCLRQVQCLMLSVAFTNLECLDTSIKELLVASLYWGLRSDH
jgi:hypothetical protein